MADEKEDPRVVVVTSTRMANGTPGDVVHGKRFKDPVTGEPASIVDILGSLGVIESDPAEDEKGDV